MPQPATGWQPRAGGTTRDRRRSPAAGFGESFRNCDEAHCRRGRRHYVARRQFSVSVAKGRPRSNKIHTGTDLVVAFANTTTFERPPAPPGGALARSCGRATPRSLRPCPASPVTTLGVAVLTKETTQGAIWTLPCPMRPPPPPG